MADNYEYYDPSEYLKHIRNATDDKKSARDIMYEATMKNLNAQRPEIKKAYDNARSGVYSASRVSSNNNNEYLARFGLAGNANTAPKSGYSETSRINQDISMQNAFNSLRTEERNAVQNLQKLMMDAQTNRNTDNLNYEAMYKEQAAKMKKEAEGINYDRRVASEQNKVDYIGGMLEKGVPMTDLQKAMWEKYTGTTIDQYNEAKAIQQQKVYDENYYNIKNAYRNNEITDLESIKDMIGTSNGISQEQYNEFEKTFKADKLKALTEEFENAETDDAFKKAVADINTAYEKGFISNKEYSNFVYTKIMKDIKSAKPDEYASLIEDIRADKDILGDKYYEVANLLFEKTQEYIKNKQKKGKYNNDTKKEVEQAKSGAIKGKFTWNAS